MADIDRSQLIGKQLALLLLGEDANGREDWAVFAGTIGERDGRLLLQRRVGVVELRDEWLRLIRATDDETRATLSGADYVVQLTVGSLPGEVSPADLATTGLTWPAGS
jgi:hypothetical protein